MEVIEETGRHWGFVPLPVRRCLDALCMKEVAMAARALVTASKFVHSMGCGRVGRGSWRRDAYLPPVTGGRYVDAILVIRDDGVKQVGLLYRG